MIRYNRAVYGNNGVLTDYSDALGNIHSGTVVLPLDTSDYLYLGSDYPFNNRYFDVLAANSVTSAMSVDLWDGTQWQAAIDVIDQTSASNKTLAQAGVISWQPDPQVSSWSWDDTPLMTSSGLETLSIYRMFWARLKVSVAVTVTTSIKAICYKFADDEELTAEYPEFSNSNLKAAYQAGKTDWKEQMLVASQYVIRELKARNAVFTENQILDWQLFSKACVHKTAHIIYTALGKDYETEKTEALRQFLAALDIRYFRTDQNGTADPTQNNPKLQSGFLTR